MKTFFLALGLTGALAAPAVAHADTLYTVTNGILSAPTPPSQSPPTTTVGTYSGTFTLSSTFTITSGSFTTTVNGTTYTMLNFTPPPYNGGGYATFFDAAGDHLNFQLFNSPNPTLCTFTSCGSGDTLFDTVVANNGSYNFYATGGTLNGTPVTTTPEPSSLVLLGTGVLGLAGAVRSRFRRA